MEYADKHKKILARQFRKAQMDKEADKILLNDKYEYEMSDSIREARKVLQCKGVNQEELIDALRRYENRHCLVFKECHRKRCEGGVWCNIYNLGGSHGSLGVQFRHLGQYLSAIPRQKRKKIMLKMLEAEKQGHE